MKRLNDNLLWTSLLTLAVGACADPDPDTAEPSFVVEFPSAAGTVPMDVTLGDVSAVSDAEGDTVTATLATELVGNWELAAHRAPDGAVDVRLESEDGRYVQSVLLTPSTLRVDYSLPEETRFLEFTKGKPNLIDIAIAKRAPAIPETPHMPIQRVLFETLRHLDGESQLTFSIDELLAVTALATSTPEERRAEMTARGVQALLPRNELEGLVEVRGGELWEGATIAVYAQIAKREFGPWVCPAEGASTPVPLGTKGGVYAASSTLQIRSQDDFDVKCGDAELKFDAKCPENFVWDDQTTAWQVPGWGHTQVCTNNSTCPEAPACSGLADPLGSPELYGHTFSNYARVRSLPAQQAGDVQTSCRPDAGADRARAESCSVTVHAGASLGRADAALVQDAVAGLVQHDVWGSACTDKDVFQDDSAAKLEGVIRAQLVACGSGNKITEGGDAIAPVPVAAPVHDHPAVPPQ